MRIKLPHNSCLIPFYPFRPNSQMLTVTKTEARYIRVQEGAAAGSLRITVPKAIAENLDIKKGDTVKVFQEGKRIVAEATE